MIAWIPSSTYRLQFNRQFTLQQATDLVDYFHELGIGALYASSLLRARPGSLHGYDIIDHATLNPELGGADPMLELEALCHKLAERGMGLIMDVVPNHMCIADPNNRLWTDVLENGPSSPYAHFFDIDWNPPKSDLTNKILLPILGDQYGRVLENQEITVYYENGAFYAQYFEYRLPLEPRSWRAILGPVLKRVSAELGESDERVLELFSTITALKNLPLPTETDRALIKERRREKEVIKRRLAALYDGTEEIRRALASELALQNGQKGEPRSFDALEALLADQSFRLCFWRVAADEINYRRFFDINELAAIRVEEPSVFHLVHDLIFRLLDAHLLSGLRIDHVDGLSDPKQYLERIQQHFRSIYGGEYGYVVAEKILIDDEKLKRDWPIAGTTGYEFLNLVNALFIDSRHRRAFLALYRRFTGSNGSFENIVYESKKLVLNAMMSSEVHVLSRKLDSISERHRGSRDFTWNSLKQALSEIIACFPVYRSYIGPYDRAVSEEDRRHINTAIRRAKRYNPATSATLFDFIASILLLNFPAELSEAELTERHDFVTHFQQLTAPVMAKGLEDTACYRFFPLASQNEVGGDPSAFGIPIEIFHQRCQERLASFPNGFCTTATHDTKRGENVRARINVLSEIPDEWESVLSRFQLLNQPQHHYLEGREVPSADEEYLFYQTLIGTWPLVPLDESRYATFVERMQSYMIKAIKEAKIHTSWINPDEEYEQALRSFIAAVLAPASENPFLIEFVPFCRRIAHAGMWNSLSELVLKIAAPGVPDFYQGTELWDHHLVDPDNRHPVDYTLRRALLAEVFRLVERDPAVACAKMLEAPEDGKIKLYVMSQSLRFRHRHAALFQNGAYAPLRALGDRRDHIISFERSYAGEQVIVVASRFFTALKSYEEKTESLLPIGKQVWQGNLLKLSSDAAEIPYRDIFSGQVLASADGGTLELGSVLGHLSIAMLKRQPSA